MTALPQLAGNPMQDALNATGIQAAHVENLWWLMFWVCTAVFVAVMVALLASVARARRAEQRDETRVSAQGERRLTRWVAGALAVSAVLLGVLFFASIFTDRALAQLPLEDALHIEVTGYQWWWEAAYDDPTPSNVFTTANELHIPVGRPVMMTLRASDVIHSLWIPNLAGKKDLIPGRTSTISRAPIALNSSVNAPAVLPSTGVRPSSRTGPVSRPTSICMMPTPVSASPARIARWIGAAPRQRGSRDAWTLRHPSRGASSTARGRISP